MMNRLVRPPVGFLLMVVGDVFESFSEFVSGIADRCADLSERTYPTTMMLERMIKGEEIRL